MKKEPIFISIQVRNFECDSWDQVKAIMHQVSSWMAANDLAYAMSRQHNNCTVRLVKIIDLAYADSRKWVQKEFQAYVGRCSGSYIQSKS